MSFIKNAKFLKISPLFFAILLLVCTSTKDQSDEIILAQIGEKEITIKEFLQRSELTIRPQNFKDKNTTLNNLIFEKILALESEDDNQLLENPAFQARLKGIKEQMMREKLYYEVAYNKVELDSDEVKNAYVVSMREYELEFFTIHNKELAKRIATVLDSAPQRAGEMFKEVEKILKEKPVHKVNYKDPDDYVIHESLFTYPLEVGTVVGPKKLSNGDYIILKVLDWVDYPLISGHDQRVRWKEVKEKIHEIKTRKLWQSYQSDIMRGKKIEFNNQSFKVLSNLALERYVNNNSIDSLIFQLTEIPSVEADVKLDSPFFTIDNILWTVEDFRQELRSHPLVFRTKYLNRNNFAEQFKLAIVDLMRDYYLTQEAYKKSLDDLEDVSRTVEMWNDSFLANYQRKNIIDSALAQGLIHEKDKLGIIEYWESYLFNLQKKYSASIKINYNELDNISLTNIDYFAIRPGVPYPLATPGFPSLVSSGSLSYTKLDN